MMCLDGMHDGGVLAVAACEVRADDGMRPFDLVVDGLAKIMQESGAFGGDRIESELACDGTGKRRDLERMLQDVLSVRGAVLETAERLDDVGMQVVNAHVESSLLAGLLHLLVDVTRRLLEHLLDAGGMDAAVGDEVLERDAGGLATYRVEAR